MAPLKASVVMLTTFPFEIPYLHLVPLAFKLTVGKGHPHSPWDPCNWPHI